MIVVRNDKTDRIDPSWPIGELVASLPISARLFDRLNLDYCCNGSQTLALACARAGLQFEVVCAALEVLDEAGARVDNGEATDWRAVDTPRLCDHIVTAHHDALRRDLPRIEALMAKVVSVHGASEPELGDAQRAFQWLRAALAPHLASEEAELFPAMIAVEHGGPPVADATLAGHEREHTEVGAALTELRSLCHDYDRGRANCNKHRALLDALEELERDLHQHVHEENNILFPRARAALATPGTGD